MKAENPCNLNGVNLQQENNKFKDTRSRKYKFYHQIDVTSFEIVVQWFSIDTFPSIHITDWLLLLVTIQSSIVNPIVEDIIKLSHEKFRNQDDINLEVLLVVANFYNCGFFVYIWPSDWYFRRFGLVGVGMALLKK